MEEWYYYDLNIFYLKFRKPSQDDYTLKSDLSFSLASSISNTKDILFSIERLNFNIGINNSSITAGRFLPRWYHTYFFRPMDIFLPVQFFKNDLVYTGIDGLQIKNYFGVYTSLAYITRPSYNLEQTSHYVNFASHLGTFDLSLFSGYEGDNHLKKTGFGFKGDLFFSLFNETVLTFKKTDKMIYQTAAGLDYSFEKIMFILEYYYQEDKIKNPALHVLSFEDNHYLFANIFYFIPLQYNIGIYGIANLEDRSSILSLYFQSEIFNGVTLLLGAYAPVSDSKEQEFSYSNTGSLILNCYLKAKF